MGIAAAMVCYSSLLERVLGAGKESAASLGIGIERGPRGVADSVAVVLLVEQIAD